MHSLENGIREQAVMAATDHTDQQDDISASQELLMKPGSTLTAHDIGFSVQVGQGRPFGKKSTKVILKGIDVVVQPGITAIMGSTGCGKTSLLDVLAGRKDHAQLSGTLLIDGKPPPRNFKCMMGYVVQENILIDTLTVRDNLNFSAALRLSQSVSNAGRREKVEQTIAELGLQQCADALIGNDFVRGISGGEKKRCHIGMEMIISPPVLFLDEPTTGLDASTAKSVINLLKTLSRAGRTIVFSIHQPRYGIYRMFDSVVLLSGGEIAYQGPPMECLDFFQDIGYVCEHHDNPADFILDVINAEHEADNKMKDLQSSVHDKVVKAYQGSKWKNRIEDVLTPVIDQHKSKHFKRPPPIQFATGTWTQFWHCSSRAMRTHIRTPAKFVTMMISTMTMASVIGFIYWQVDSSCKSGLQNRIGVFFFLLTNSVFSNISAVDVFIHNRGHFLHETISGYYRTSAYFLSSVVCDITIMRFIPTIFFTLVAYFMIGLTAEATHYGIFFLALFMSSVAAASVSFLFSALVKTYPVANLMVSLIFMFMAVFGGLLVNLDSVPTVLHLFKYLSIFRYSLTVLSICELHGKEFGQISKNETCPTGDDYLRYQGISFSSSWDLWSNIAILLGFTVIILLLAYLRLRFMNKHQ